VLAVAGVALLLLLASYVITAGVIRNSRQSALAHAQDQVLRFANGAQAGLNRSLLGVDVMLASVDDLLQTSSRMGDRVDPELANQLLRSGVEQTLLVRNVMLLGTDGTVMASSDRRGQQIDLSLPEGFLQRVLQSAMYTVSVSDPVIATDGAEHWIYLGRTVKLADGRKLIAVAQLPVSLLATVLAQGAGTGGLEVTLERNDGQVLVSAPDAVTQAIAVKNGSLADLVASGAVETLPSRLSGAPSLQTARRSLYRSLWITAALPMDSALALWRVERKSVEGAALVVMLLILLGSIFAGWYLLRLGRIRDDLAQSRAVLDQALNSMASGFLMLDAQSRVTRWNQRYEDLVPGLRGQLTPLMTGQQAFELVAGIVLPQASPIERTAWVSARIEKLQTRGEHEVQYPNGRTVHVSIRATPDGGTVCVLHDMTEEKQDQASLRIAATAFEAQEGMLVTDAQCSILRVNRAFSEITGYSADDVQGQNPRMLSSGRHDAAFFLAMWRSIDEEGHWQGEVVNRRKNGETFSEYLTITAVKDESGGVTHYVATMLDITLRQAAAEEIRRLAFHDSLTGLPNRRLLMDRLQQALAASARSGRRGALLFLDLDHFKWLNDTLGHDIGDALLREVGLRLSAAVREGDTVARLGGDEFVVLLENLSEHPPEAAEQARAIGEKIRATLNQPYLLEQHRHQGSCSLGAVLFGGSEVAADDLLKHADLAMYTAKRAGRNALRFFDPQMQTSVVASNPADAGPG
jgi:diguanylate cyclase (GGDEF)-like protein/PAS domain S-box-containing protein